MPLLCYLQAIILKGTQDLPAGEGQLSQKPGGEKAECVLTRRDAFTREEASAMHIAQTASPATHVLHDLMHVTFLS